MADSVAQVRHAADLLRSWGFRVVEVDGWEHRGSGDLTTAGRIEHHTAGSREGDAPSLRTVTFGRPGLRNALCRWYVSRSGVIYLVARRRAWHAGQGTKGSNATLSGTEAENDGRGEPWTPRSLEAQAAISAAECITFGVSAQRVWDHREHAERRKIDRSGIDSHQWRRRVAALADGGPPELTEEEDVLKRGDRGGEVRVLCWRINQYLHGESDPRARGKDFGLPVTTLFNEDVERYVKHLQSGLGYATTGRYDLALAMRMLERLIQVGVIRPKSAA